MITAICKNCSKEFLKYPSSSKMFCSKQCDIEYRSKKVEKVKFTCEECGKEFTRTRREINSAKNQNQQIRFCSLKCKSDHWGKNRVEVTCPVCGKKFLQQKNKANLKYCCSPECSAKNPNNRRLMGQEIDLKCPVCEKIFKKRVSYIRKTAKKGQKVWCCSKKCADAYKTIHPNKTKPNVSKKRLSIKPMKTFECLNCHKEFQNRKNRKFCSNECRLIYVQKGTKEIQCQQCDKTFKTTAYKIKQGRKYCSIACRDKARQIEYDTYGKLAHYLRSTKVYEDWRKSVCDNAHWHCEICGEPINGNLEVHHKITLYQICKKYDFDIDSILTSQEFTDINNGSCLCLDCHIKQHPYNNKLRNKKGQFCRREFNTTEKLTTIRTELSGEGYEPNPRPKAS